MLDISLSSSSCANLICLSIVSAIMLWLQYIKLTYQTNHLNYSYISFVDSLQQDNA
jgi:hypothetical protein